jgi:hypothetical protein
MTWNKKNQQFALSCGLRPSSKELIQWTLRRAKPGQVCEIEIDLRVFNKFIEGDRGSPYDRKTLKEALQQLDEKTQGLILITKSYTWAIHKIIVRPLEMVLQRNSQTGDNAPKLATGNPMFDADHKKRVREQQQQNISKLDSFLSNLGFKFTRDNVAKLWRMSGKSMQEITTAVEYLLHAHSTQKTPITSPHGWLVDSLKYGWHQGFNLHYQLELPVFQTAQEIFNHVKAALDTRVTQVKQPI